MRRRRPTGLPSYGCRTAAMPVCRPGIRFRGVREWLVAGVLTSGVRTSSRGSHIRGRKALLIDAVTQDGPCQVRSRTESPCLRRTVVEIRGISFCKACAREQEAYFAIGELTQEALDGMRRPRADGLAAATRFDLSRSDELGVLRLRKARQSQSEN